MFIIIPLPGLQCSLQYTGILVYWHVYSSCCLLVMDGTNFFTTMLSCGVIIFV